MVTMDGGGDGDSEDGGNGINNGDEGSCESRSAQNEATQLTSVGSISLFPLLQCWRSVAVSHLMLFQRTSCGDHLCACLLGLAYLGGTLMAVLRDSELSGNAQTKAFSCCMSWTPAAIWLP